MVYSTAMRKAIGETRAALAAHGLTMGDARFARHGEHEVDPGAPLLLVACSGGRDSLALAAVAHIVATAWGLRCGAVVVDHGLQEDSADVVRDAARACARQGLAPVETVRVDVAVDGRGAEAAAREARYAALADAARRLGAEAVLLAHTRDDQAEGVLIGLIRSGGTDAVAGMPAVQHVEGVTFLRPFLDVTRAQTTAICADLGLRWWDDPTNGDAFDAREPLPERYPLRSRVRHTLMPALDAFAGRDMAAKLARGARAARRDVDYLEACAAPVFDACVEMGRDDRGLPEARLDARRLALAPEALRFRVIARVLALCAPGSGSRHVDAVESLVSRWHGQQPVRLPSGYSANRKKHVIRVCEDGPHANRRRARQHRS